MLDKETKMMEMMEMMKECRWCVLVPIMLGIIFFLVGYFLDAEIVRDLWLVFFGVIALMGIFGFIMMSTISRR